MTASTRPTTARVERDVEARTFWLAIGAVVVAAGVFLWHQLMAWPPHEDETLALFVGRDSSSESSSM